MVRQFQDGAFFGWVAAKSLKQREASPGIGSLNSLLRDMPNRFKRELAAAGVEGALTRRGDLEKAASICLGRREQPGRLSVSPTHSRNEESESPSTRGNLKPHDVHSNAGSSSHRSAKETDGKRNVDARSFGRELASAWQYAAQDGSFEGEAGAQWLRSVLGDVETSSNIHGLLLILRHASLGAPTAMRCDQLVKGWDPRVVLSEREEAKELHNAKPGQGRPKSATPAPSSHRSRAHTDLPNTARAANGDLASGSRPGIAKVAGAKVAALENELADKTRRIEELEQRLMKLESADAAKKTSVVPMSIEHPVSNYFRNTLVNGSTNTLVKEAPSATQRNNDLEWLLRPPPSAPTGRRSALI
jgi:hypothetical protein